MNNSTQAVLVMDMTNDSIMPEARAVDLRLKMMPQAVKFLDWARKSGRPVLHVDSARRATDKWFLKYWEFANKIFSLGQQPIPSLLDETDAVVHKRRYSGFFESDLDLTLREMGVQSVIIIGYSTSLAVMTTAFDAWQNGYETTVLSDLTIAHAWGGRSVEDNHQWSLDAIKAFAMARIATSEELIAYG